MKSKSRRPTEAAHLTAQGQSSAWIHLQSKDHLRSHLEGDTSESNIQASLISANIKQCGQSFRVLIQPTVLSSGQGKVVPPRKCEHGVRLDDSGRAEWCPACFDSAPQTWTASWPEGVKWDEQGGFLGTRRTARPRRITDPSIEAIPEPNIHEEATLPSLMYPQARKRRRKEESDLPGKGSHDSKPLDLPQTRNPWPPACVAEELRWAMKAPAPVVSFDPQNRDTLVIKRRSSKLNDRVYCPNHKQLQWVARHDDGIVLLECGCERKLRTDVSVTATMSDRNVKAGMRKLARALEKIGEREVEDDDQIVKQGEWIPDSGLDIAEAEDTTSNSSRTKPTNQLIEGHDDVDAYLPVAPKEDHKQPPQYTLEDITELARLRKIRLTLAQKRLLALKVHRSPGKRRAHKLSERRIALLLGKSPDWVRYHYPRVLAKFSQEDQQLIAIYGRRYTEKRQSVPLAKETPMERHDGGLESLVEGHEPEWEALFETMWRCHVSPEKFAEILARGRLEILHAVLDALIARQEPTFPGAVLTGEQRAIIAGLVREVQVQGNRPS